MLERKQSLREYNLAALGGSQVLAKDDLTEVQQCICCLLDRVESLQRSRGWSDSYLGKKAVGDDTFLIRLRGNLRVQVNKVVALESFVSELEAGADPAAGDGAQ